MTGYGKITDRRWTCSFNEASGLSRVPPPHTRPISFRSDVGLGIIEAGYSQASLKVLKYTSSICGDIASSASRADVKVVHD